MNDEANEVVEELFNPNKAGLFQGIFSWVKASYFKKNISSFNTTLHNF